MNLSQNRFVHGAFREKYDYVFRYLTEVEFYCIEKQ